MESHEQNPPNGRSDRSTSATSASGDAARTIGERLDHVNATAEQAWSRTRDAVGDLRETLDIDGRVSRHPYGTVAAALGIGYVLGGGIFTPLTARLVGFGLRMGLRLAAIPFLQNELLGMVGSVGSGASEGSGERSGSSGRKAQHTKTTNKG